MAECSRELTSLLNEFMISEIGSRALDGITYTLLLKNSSKDKTIYDRYMKIKNEAIKCGFNSEEKFRIYEVSNGYIFDMDLNTAKVIIAEISKAVEKENNIEVGDILKDMPEQRRKKDLIALGNYLKSEYDKGNTTVEVALFSKNATNKIVINGKSPDGKNIALKYNAYAIRHWDIEVLNEKILIPAGFRVKSIQPCEVLPSKTGVSFKFIMESMDQYMNRY